MREHADRKRDQAVRKELHLGNIPRTDRFEDRQNEVCNAQLRRNRHEGIEAHDYEDESLEGVSPSRATTPPANM